MLSCLPRDVTWTMEQVRSELCVHGSTSVGWYLPATGRAINNARCLQFLAEHEPAYGYWANPSKLIYICKGEDERIARAAFTALGLTVKYRRGARYLGSFLGCRTLLEDYVRDKITTWSSAASTLAKLAVKYPQSVYTGYIMCLQSEWQYLCRDA